MSVTIEAVASATLLLTYVSVAYPVKSTVTFSSCSAKYTFVTKFSESGISAKAFSTFSLISVSALEIKLLIVVCAWFTAILISVFALLIEVKALDVACSAEFTASSISLLALLTWLESS